VVVVVVGMVENGLFADSEIMLLGYGIHRTLSRGKAQHFEIGNFNFALDARNGQDEEVQKGSWMIVR
jgi:hypothetical protein